MSSQSHTTHSTSDSCFFSCQLLWWVTDREWLIQRVTIEVALQGWGNSSFNVEMYEWVDITDGMRDTKLINHGTCQLAMKRLGGYSSSLDDLLVIGDQDLRVLMNTSIEMARFGDGTKLHVVDGSMNCTTPADSDSPRGGTIYWTLRRTGIIEGYPPKGPFA